MYVREEHYLPTVNYRWIAIPRYWFFVTLQS